MRPLSEPRVKRPLNELEREDPLRTFAELGRALGRALKPSGRPVVCVQGLGFVGAAMAAAVAHAHDSEGRPHFDVVGVDLPTREGRAKVDALNNGRAPMATNDEDLVRVIADAHRRGNLLATIDVRAFALASVTVVNVPLDVVFEEDVPTVSYDHLREAIRTLGLHMPAGALVIVETTVPPGTCERVAAPELAQALAERGLPADAVMLAHSPERVMPGDSYLDSVVNFWRTYAGHTEEAGEACHDFLSKVVNVEDYPLTRLQSTLASETSKVLENSYRATTIAFMEEWGRFAEAVGIDLFEVIGAIRRRPTHSNMRQPGFGVGGYCITKDPLLAQISARELFGRGDLAFPFSTQAVAVNSAMPLVSLRRAEALLDGVLQDKTILLMGVSYREDVGDTRHSPAETFVRQAHAAGATVLCHDPLVAEWPELDLPVLKELPPPDGVDLVVFAVPHRDYAALDFSAWLNGSRPAVLDANDVLSPAQRQFIRERGCKIGAIGRGFREE
jgi:UDP-N-acetyl-D-glucosamine dehydrogenase